MLFEGEAAVSRKGVFCEIEATSYTHDSRLKTGLMLSRGSRVKILKDQPTPFRPSKGLRLTCDTVSLARLHSCLCFDLSSP